MTLEYIWVCPLCGLVLVKETRLSLVEERERHIREVHVKPKQPR